MNIEDIDRICGELNLIEASMEKTLVGIPSGDETALDVWTDMNQALSVVIGCKNKLMAEMNKRLIPRKQPASA